MLGPTRVAYLDHHGSGAETAAHLPENGRIVGLRTTVREGKRSLRGEPDAEPKLLVETVRRAPSGAIDRIVAGTP